jgi:hypothetical protein
METTGVSRWSVILKLGEGDENDETLNPRRRNSPVPRLPGSPTGLPVYRFTHQFPGFPVPRLARSPVSPVSPFSPVSAGDQQVAEARMTV